MVQLGVRHHATSIPLSSDKLCPTEALSRPHDHLLCRGLKIRRNLVELTGIEPATS